jgi:hypothetical protein
MISLNDKLNRRKDESMNRIGLFTVVMLTMALTVVQAGGNGEAVNWPVPEGYSSVEEEGITIQWKIEEQNLRIRMAGATTGWVAVGFDPSSRMRDANIIIGYVEDGQVFLRDEFGTGGTSHSPDEELGGNDDTEDAQGGEENGQTWLSFSIPLDSGDRYDRALAPGKSVKVILATGRNDDFGTYHGMKRAVVTLDL